MSLPTRRPCVTTSVEHGGETFHITTGFDPREELIWGEDGRVEAGSPIETFVHGPKVGTALWSMAQTSAISTSYSLQRGRKIENMLKDAPRGANDEPVCVIGVTYDLLAEEKERYEALRTEVEDERAEEPVEQEPL